MDTILSCDCGRPIAPNDQNSLLHGACFKCRIQNVGITFRGGGGYGKAQFHESTNAEFLRENDGPGTSSARYR
jgi:hypothetical protein